MSSHMPKNHEVLKGTIDYVLVYSSEEDLKSQAQDEEKAHPISEF